MKNSQKNSVEADDRMRTFALRLWFSQRNENFGFGKQ